jgi:putative GTP pyrophosphokinase
MPFSKTKIDRLGDRLRVGPATEGDLRLLDEYRRTFQNAYDTVVRRLRDRGEFPTGRPAKSTISIIEKLRRESLRLSQMQDVAGCRVVVRNVLEQDNLVAELRDEFHRTAIMDRRLSPSFGYRAVHIIAEESGKPIEIQVRTLLQHLWAEASEKSSDVLDPSIKYGGGPEQWRMFLTKSSESVAAFEVYEVAHFKLTTSKEVADVSYEDFRNKAESLSEDDLPEGKYQEIKATLHRLTLERQRREQEFREMVEDLERCRRANVDLLTKTIATLDKLRGQKQ